MPQHHYQPRLESLGCEFHAPYLRGRNDISCHPDHEEIAESLIEHDLSGDARVGAAEDDGEGLLALSELWTARPTQESIGITQRGCEAVVSFLKSGERFARTGGTH